MLRALPRLRDRQCDANMTLRALCVWAAVAVSTMSDMTRLTCKVHVSLRGQITIAIRDLWHTIDLYSSHP